MAPASRRNPARTTTGPALTTFTADAAAALAGPDWLRARRAAAHERFAGMSLPTTEEEVWRYSRVDDLDLDDFAPAPVADPEAGITPEVAALVDALGPRSGLVVVRNGRLALTEVDEPLVAKGLYVGPASEDDLEIAARPHDALGELHDAFAPEPLAIRVPAGLTVPRPIVVLNWTDAEGAAVFPRLVIRAGADSEATVFDHSASADVRALVVPVVELEAGPASRLRYLNAQQLGYRVWQIGNQASTVGQEASLQTATVALGGDYARLRIDSAMVGRGGSGEMLAVYFGEGDQMHDFRTLQDHRAPNTTSELVFKGAVEDHARAVYTGLIRVQKDAPGVNAFQTNRNIKLSEGAWAESVPNLDIMNNDVRCSHASAIGPVDEEQRFYLESRGIHPETAERLIVLGFFQEILDRLPLAGAAGVFRNEVAAKLDRRPS